MFALSWPQPVLVTGAVAAASGDVEMPAEIADDTVVAPFAGIDRFLVERAPAAAALVSAIGRLVALPATGTLPSRDQRSIVVGTWSAALNEVHDFMAEVETVGGSLVNPGLFPFTVINAAAGRAAIEHGCEGANLTLNNGPTSALDAIAYAADLTAAERSQMVFAGGFEGLGEAFGEVFGRRGDGAAPARAAAVAAVLSLVTPRYAAASGAAPRARLLAFCSVRGEEAAVPDAAPQVLAAALDLARSVAGGSGAVLTAMEPLPLAGLGAERVLLALVQAVRLAADAGHRRLVPVLVANPERRVAAALVLGPPNGF